MARYAKACVADAKAAGYSRGNLEKAFGVTPHALIRTYVEEQIDEEVARAVSRDRS